MTKLSWIEKINVGIKLIAEGCESNETWDGCQFCPFDEVCDLINKGRGAEFESIADIFNEIIEKNS